MSVGRVLRTGLGVLAVAAVAVSGVLAGSRLLAPGSRRGIELVALAPAGLPLALAGLLVLLLVVRRPVALVVPALVVAVALALLHGWWLAPRFTGGAPEAASGSPSLVVMTQNLEQGDAAQVVDLVERRSVDVLVLTDAGEDQVAAVVAAGIGDALPHDTLETGAGSVVWSRHPILSDALLSDGGDSRIVTLLVPDLGEVGVVALHPTPPYQDDGRRWQADWDQVLTGVRATYGDRVPGRVLVAGDLNATLDHAPVRALEDLGFRDAGEQLDAGLGLTWPANGARSRLGVSAPVLVALDHVMTAAGLVAVDQVLTDAAGSDHLGVVATLAEAAN